MNNSESGRKFNQAVTTTGRALGGAISHAKGTLTNWLSSLSTPAATNTTATSKTSNGTVIDDRATSNNGINIETEEIKSCNGNDVINSQEFENKEKSFEHKKQLDFLKGYGDGVTEGIVEIGIEATVLHSK